MLDLKALVWSTPVFGFGAHAELVKGLFELLSIEHGRTVHVAVFVGGLFHPGSVVSVTP
jgi:hypothetical protein